MGNLETGSTAIVSTESTALNLRGHPVLGDNVVGSLPRHSLVHIDGPPQGGFYPVTAHLASGAVYGFASGTYLTHYDAPPAPAPSPPQVADIVVPAFVPGVVDVPIPVPVLVDPGVVGPGPAVVVEEPSHARRNAMILGGTLLVVGVGAALVNRSHAKSLHAR